MGKTVGRGQKRWDGIYFDFYHSMPDIPEKLHEDTVSTAYGLLVNICTVFHMNPAVALFFMVRRPHRGPGLITVEASRSQTHTHKFGRTALDEWSDCRKNLHLTTQYSQQTPMPPAGFERSSNISTLASRLNRICARWIPLSCHSLF